MRTARVKVSGRASYHCLSRVVDRQRLFGAEEKEHFRVLLRECEGFCGVHVLSFSVLSNHFHVGVEVPKRREVSDGELVRRVGAIYGKAVASAVEEELRSLREAGETDAADALKGRYTYRMYDLSEFMKTLKQRFTQWYNRRHGRKGTLWEERFTSKLLEGRGSNALWLVSAYIDLNAVRAGLVSDPKDYRYCGYGEAMGGGEAARAGLRKVMEGRLAPDADWEQVASAYRAGIFERGSKAPEGQAQIAPERVREVLEGRGRLSRAEVLRCTVRYFIDGLVQGSEEYVEEVLAAHPELAGTKRRPRRPRPLRFADFGGLCTLRNPRKPPIAPSP